MAVISTQYVWVPVVAVKNGQAYNPTGDTVQMAFMQANAEPSSGNWNTAVWQTSTAGGVTSYLAGTLVGPANGGLVLAIGSYSVWVRVTDNPEVPAMMCGTLTIF